MPKNAKNSFTKIFQEAERLFTEGRYAEAKAEYIKILDKGDSHVANALGIIAFIYEQYDEASQMFYRAFLQNDADGAHNLAVCYEHGFSVFLYLPIALYYYAESASKGNASANSTLTEYFASQGKLLGDLLQKAEVSEYVSVIETHILQSLSADPIMSPFQILKHPINRRVVTGILRQAQKYLVQFNAMNALLAISQLFRYEFVLHDFDNEHRANEVIIITKASELIILIEQYGTYLNKKRNDRAAQMKVFQSILKSAKINLLTRMQQQAIGDAFLKAINDEKCDLSGDNKHWARMLAPMIATQSSGIDMLQILNTLNNSEEQLESAFVKQLPVQSNGKNLDTLLHPDNLALIKSVLHEACMSLANTLTMANAVKLIALLEFKEKIFGLDIAPLFFMKLLHDLKLICSSNLVWILERLENVDCINVNSINGFYTLLNKIINALPSDQIENELVNLSSALTNMVTTIHATQQPTFAWETARSTVGQYRMAMIAYMYQRTQQLHPIVEMMSKVNDLSAKNTWPTIFSTIPRPAEGVDRLTYTSDAIWFVTTFLTSKIPDLQETNPNLKKNAAYLLDFIESYDTYLLILEKGTDTSKSINHSKPKPQVLPSSALVNPEKSIKNLLI